MAVRKRVLKDRRCISWDDMTYHGRPVPAWIENMKTVLADFDKPEYFDARLEVESCHDEPDTVYIVSFRDETDKEMEKRLLREKNKRERSKEVREKVKADKKMEELRELSRLKAKYEPVPGSANGRP